MYIDYKRINTIEKLKEYVEDLVKNKIVKKEDIKFDMIKKYINL